MQTEEDAVYVGGNTLQRWMTTSNLQPNLNVALGDSRLPSSPISPSRNGDLARFDRPSCKLKDRVRPTGLLGRGTSLA
jgi:hypothetical protein